MKESATYQAIVAEGLAEGALKEARRFLLQLGEELFGKAAPASVKAKLETLKDPEHLELLGRRLLHARSWSELLREHGKPQPRKYGKS